MSDPPTTPARRLELALRETYAAGWPFYDKETRDQLAAYHTRLTLPSIMEALRRARLKLEDADANP